MVHWENHVGDDAYQTAETAARWAWYAGSGIPHVRIDGSRFSIGAGSCAQAAAAYRTLINQRIAETSGLSPVEIIGTWLPTESEITMQANFRLVDPATLTSLRATLLLYEDHCYSGGQYWEHVTRKIHDQNITLTNVGDVVNVATTIPLNPNWNAANLVCVAYLQQTSGTKPIIQGALLPLLEDFEFAFEGLVRSVPSGNGVAIFNGTVTNIGDATDTITLEIGESFPFWATRFYVCGDANPHTTPVDVILDPGESCDIMVQVATDDVKEVRSGSFLTTSAFSGRTQTSNLRVYNGSYSVFFVDDDYNRTDETKIVNALTEHGYLFEMWDCYHDYDQQTPFPNNYSGYDIVIWHTGQGNYSATAPDSDDMDRLMDYMDAGGSLFLTSQRFLNTLTGGGNTFTTDYLGLSGWTLDTKYPSIVGVAGDVIGDGLTTMPLNYQFASWNTSDDAIPGATAVVGMRGSDQSGALIHHDTRGFRCVFMPTCFTALSDTDPDPNNTKVLLGRIMDWLEPPPAMDAGDVNFLMATRIDAVQPNPFNPRTEIRFYLSSTSAGAPIRLEIIDLGGRKVASLFEGALPAGRHARTWAGVTDEGRPVQSGVYFVNLITSEGSRSEKLVLLK